MKQSLTDHPTATIYQYKHVKRIIVRNEMLISYLICTLIILAFQYAAYQLYGLFSWLIGFAAIQLIHLIIILLTFINVHEAADRKWKWSIIPPWTGFKPANDISFSVFRKVHAQLFWLGAIIIGVMYPWLPPSLMLSLIFWHIWLLAPKLLLNMRLRKFTKKKKAGILRIQTKEVNLYQP